MFEWWRAKGLNFGLFPQFSGYVVKHACQHTVEHIIRVLPNIFTNDDVVELIKEPSNFSHMDLKEMVQKFLDLGLALTPPCMYYAVENRAGDLAKWLFSKGCPTDRTVFRVAALRGMYDLFPWLVEIQCPMSPEVLEPLALRGELKHIQYLTSKGCRFSEEIFIRAVRGDQPHVVDWLKEHGCPIPASDE